MKNHKNFNKDQAGIASLLFSLVMMIVISLIVLSFAQVARRNQRQSLDSQLSNQAYYAAESGINDAEQGINHLVSLGESIDTNGCDAATQHATNANFQPYYTPTVGTNVAYTCLSVNSHPGSLQASLDTKSSKVLNITPSSTISQLTLTWTKPSSSSDPVTNCPNNGSYNGDFKPATGIGSWTAACPYGVVRFDLVPTSGTLSRASLLTGDMSVFAVPSSANDPSTNKLDYSAASGGTQGLRGNGACDTNTCTLVITGLPATASSYAMRVMSIYDTVSNLTVTGQDSAGTDVSFTNGQAVIDVTGKAQDVLRRIQVRVPIGGSKGGYADYAIASQDSICKRFSFIGGTFTPDGSCPTIVP